MDRNTYLNNIVELLWKDMYRSNFEDEPLPVIFSIYNGTPWYSSPTTSSAHLGWNPEDGWYIYYGAYYEHALTYYIRCYETIPIEWLDYVVDIEEIVLEIENQLIIKSNLYKDRYEEIKQLLNKRGEHESHILDT